MAEKVKPITLHTENGEYTLEFNRETVRFAEQRGFDISDLGKFPMTKIPELFFYSFRMHHRNVSRAETDRILFEEMGGMSNDVAVRLGELYSAPFEALTNEEAGKNSKVTVEM